MDRISKPAAVSAVLHLLVLAVLIHQGAARIAPMRLPGTESGHNLTLTYLPGRAPIQTAVAEQKTPPKAVTPVTPLPTPTVAKLTTPTTPSPNTNSPATTKPDSSVGADSLGSATSTSPGSATTPHRNPTSPHCRVAPPAM